MTGGADEDLAQVQPLFDILGRYTVHVGAVGAGHAANALNNFVSAVSVAINVEALHVTERFGIDGDRCVEVLNASSGRSNTSENKARQFMLSGSFASRLPIGLMVKDIDIAQAWHKAYDDGYAGEDHTRMYEYL